MYSRPCRWARPCHPCCTPATLVDLAPAAGIKIDGDGCYFANSKDGNKPYRARATSTNGFYQCGCAKSNTATWRAKGGCLSTERNSYYTCRVKTSTKVRRGRPGRGANHLPTWESR